MFDRFLVPALLLSCFIFVMILSVPWGANTKSNNLQLLVLSWSGLVSIMAGFGFFINTQEMPPRIGLVLAGSLLIYGWLFAKMRQLPYNRTDLILSQTVRLPIEIILYTLYLERRIPLLMTFKGYNFDILIGLTALIILLYETYTSHKVHPKLFQIWNLAGMFSLCFIVILAILSIPFFNNAFGIYPPNTAVLEFPYVLLPGYFVPILFVNHLMLWRSIKT